MKDTRPTRLMHDGTVWIESQPGMHWELLPAPTPEHLARASLSTEYMAQRHLLYAPKGLP